MFKRTRDLLTFANVCSFLALAVAISTGGAYAANTVFSTDIVNGEVKTADLHASAVTSGKIAPAAVTSGKVDDGTLLGIDLADGTVTGLELQDGTVQAVDLAGDAVTSSAILDGNILAADLADSAVTETKIEDGAVTSAKVLDDSLAGGGLGPQDLATNSVTQTEIATDGVAATEIQEDSIDTDEIIDFGLTNQDIGVLFAEVSATGTLGSHSGGVTATKLANPGEYEVDFDHVVNVCAAVATIGPSGTSTASGEINVADRSGNVEAVFVDTNTSTGAAADRPFRLVVVC